MVFSLGTTIVRVFATLNRTFATESFDIARTVGSIRRSVISVPQASAKTLMQNRQVMRWR